MQNSLDTELFMDYVICGACDKPISKDLVMVECSCGKPICCYNPCHCEGVWDHLKWFANARYYALFQRYTLIRKISHFPIWCKNTILTFLRNLNTTDPRLAELQVIAKERMQS